MNTLAAALQHYFTSYARAQRDLSPNTIAAYRDTWRMLITHLADTLGVPASRIDFQALDVERVTAFLDHLEQARSNSVSTRNARLTAIRAVLSHAQPSYPEHAATIMRILAVPPKRHPKPILEFLSAAEADALLAAPARTTWTGIRDHALLALDIQTGLRVSELCSLTTASIRFGTGAHVTCTGKGRRHRATPITAATTAIMTAYLDQRITKPGNALFCGPRGQQLSRDALEHRLALHLATATARCPSLADKNVTMHTLRHYADGRVMWPAVASPLVAEPRVLVPAT
jgi:site-specific recombinase XerD